MIFLFQQLCHNLRGLCHEVVVEESLSLGEATTHHMLIFLGHLLLHISLDPPEQKGPQHLVESLDQALVVLLTALNHSCQRVGEPLLKFAVGLEDVGHEEVHKRPQLHQAVLQRGSCQQQSPVAGIRRGKRRNLCKCVIVYVIGILDNQGGEMVSNMMEKKNHVFILLDGKQQEFDLETTRHVQTETIYHHAPFFGYCVITRNSLHTERHSCKVCTEF